MKKKFLTVALSAMLAVTAVAGLSACSEEGDVKFEAVAKEDIKIGMIALHDESSTYDKTLSKRCIGPSKIRGLRKISSNSLREFLKLRNAMIKRRTL